MLAEPSVERDNSTVRVSSWPDPNDTVDVDPGKAPKRSGDAVAYSPDATARVVRTEPMAAASSGAFTRGDLIGRYVILDKLGQGGMGVVYSAFDPELNRRVAIKVLRTRLGDEGSLGNQTMLLREAQAMAQLSHPNVLPVYDVGTIRQRVFIATEYVEGRTLKQWVEEKLRSWREIVAMYVAAGRGLSAAHRAGLIHRDFKPHNVLVSQDGAVRVMDFGLARSTRSGDPSEDAEVTANSEERSSRGVLGQSMTAAGTVMGTPAYMAPEQHAGALVDATADQYAFCVALWEALYGSRPFVASVGSSLVDAKRALQIRPVRERHVPRWLKRVLLRGLAPNAAERWPSMDALLRVLKHDPARRARRLAAGSVLLATTLGSGLAVAHFGAQTPEPCQGAGEYIEAVWNPQTRAQVSTALLATGRPHAAPVADRLFALVDTYASDWTATRTAACRATRVHQEQSEAVMDSKMTCLDHSLEQVDTYLQALTGAMSDQALNHATTEFRRLSSLALCRDTEALARRNEVPVPAGEQDAVDALGQSARRLQALVAASALQRIEPQIKAVERYLARVSHAPSRARALEVQHAANYLLGRPDECSRILEEIRLLAVQYDDKKLLSLVWTQRLWTLVVEERRMDAARELVPVAETAATLARNEPDGHYLQADMGQAVAALELLQGDLAAAERRYRDVFQFERYDRFSLLSNLSVVLIYRGKVDEARAALVEAELEVEKNVGSLHPVVADIFLNRGLSYHWQGELAEAERWYRRAIDMGFRTMADNVPRLSLYRLYLGGVLVDLGRWKDAEDELSASIRGFAATHGPTSEFAIHGRVQSARLELERGDVAAARTEMDAILSELDDTKLDQFTRGYAHPLYVDGVIALAEHDVDRATSSFERALATYRELYEPSSLEFVLPLLGLARADLAKERAEAARDHLAEALTLLQDGPGSVHDLRIAKALEIQSRLHAANDSNTTFDELSRALSIWEHTAPNHPHVATIRDRLEAENGRPPARAR